MSALPSGTVTILFTDIEGSTRLLERLGDGRYAEVLEEHRRLLRRACDGFGGREISTPGDAFLAVFARASDAVGAAIAAQQALARHPWPDESGVRVRMGLHAGEPTSASGDYGGIDMHRSARICAAGHGGQILVSEAAKSLAEAHLPPETRLQSIGLHRLKDLQRPEHLFQVFHPDLRPAFPPLRSLDAHPNNLGLQLSSFVGRERELRDVKAALQNGRLITLSGPGGVGKTRLALQVAAEVLHEFDDGVWSVELASLSDPALVPQTVAMTLGVQEAPHDSPLGTLVHALRARRALIVLDNCEHLVDACARLAEALLRGCSGLKILATSREPLAIPGEAVYTVPPFTVPDPATLPALAALAKYEAVRLFVERAGSSKPGFTMDTANASAIAQACYRLDGIPLALELAAARVGTLTVTQIVERLDARFGLLTGGARTALPRHQTLRATMDWSHDLLSSKEQALFRRLAVFAGGFTLEAAEAVGAGDQVPGDDVLELLAQLLAKSLLVAAGTDREVRYGMLETVRQYSQERLDASTDAAAAQERHQRYYVEFAEAAEPHLEGPEQLVWLDRIETEHDNLRAALAWGAGHGDAEPMLRLCAALWWFWYVRGYHSEGRRWLGDALAHTGKVSPAVKARALDGAGTLAADQGDYTAALACFEQSLAIHRDTGRTAGVARALHGIGRVAWRKGDYERAAARYEEALALRGQLGVSVIIGQVLNSLITLAMARGEHQKAAALLHESLVVNRELGNKRAVVVATGNLGILALRLGNYADAAPLIRETLALRRELGDRRGVVSELVALGLLRAAERDAAQAARLLGAAEAIGESIGAPLSSSERAVADYDRYVAIARVDLGEEALAREWAVGRTMTLEQALTYALTETE